MNTNASVKEVPSIQGKLISLTCLFVTVVFWSQGTDPFNLPKLAILTVGSFALLGSLLDFRVIRRFEKLPLVVTGLFILALLNSFIFSGAPKLQMFFGVYARNTGFLDYLSLAILFFGATTIRKSSDFQRIQRVYFLALGIVTLVCILEIFGINIQKVSLTFKGALIGTLGNPNFISAYLGMGGTALFAVLLGLKKNLLQRTALLLPLTVIAWLILRSSSRQGIVVLIGGCAFVFFFYLRSLKNTRFLQIIYLGITSIVGIFSIAGALKKGPLADLIYKSSVSFRGEYWNAGIEMFKSHPFAGVGLNSYGDWYRTLRSSSAIISPGPEVFTNTAHNIYIDYAAAGGLPLLIAFLAIILLTSISVIRFIKNDKEFDGTFYSILGAWVVYLVQGLISIDQIGVAIWGWVLPGLLIGYESKTRSSLISQVSELRIQKRKNSKTEDNLVEAGILLKVLVSSVAALVLVIPVVKSDFDIRKAYDSSSAELLIAAAKQYPINNYKISNVTGLLINSNLGEKSLELANFGIEKYPRSFDLWKLIYFNSLTPDDQRKLALKKMVELDPLNPNVIAELAKQ
jgi:O-antigen ligase